MSKEFSGVWATFEYLDDTCNSIKELRKEGYRQLTTHTPCPRHEIDHALGNPQSSIPWFTLFGMFCGSTLAVVIMVFMTLDWVLPVSGKPVISVPSMGPIFFELSVICAIWITLFGTVGLILKDTFGTPRPTSKRYKGYDRFMRDRFGVVVPCSEHDYEKVEAIMNRYQAEEVHREA